MLNDDIEDTTFEQGLSAELLKSYLEIIKHETLNHYTVLDFEKINENIPDIDKYAMKRVVSEPIKDRDLNMDHLCFVDIFPKGRYGMYYDRPNKVHPAMYLRWIINQANPNARRNIQYLFSAVHNKDVRSIDSGIFHSVNTTKIPNMKADDFLNNVHTNEKKYVVR